MNTNPLTALVIAFPLGLSGGIAIAADLKLSGANEVPPVTTAASGFGTITVADDGSVSGGVKVMASPPRWHTYMSAPRARMDLSSSRWLRPRRANGQCLPAPSSTRNR